MGVCLLEGSYSGKARVGGLPGHVCKVATKPRQCGGDVVPVDSLQVLPHQLLGVMAAVEIDVYTQQELVEPGGPGAGPRPVHDRDGPVSPDEQVVGADIGVEKAIPCQAG